MFWNVTFSTTNNIVLVLKFSFSIVNKISDIKIESTLFRRVIDKPKLHSS